MNEKSLTQLRNIWNKSNKDQLEFCGNLCLDKKRQYLVVKPTIQLKGECRFDSICDINFHTHPHFDSNLSSCKFDNDFASLYDIEPPSPNDFLINIDSKKTEFIVSRMGIWEITPASTNLWDNLDEYERAGLNNYFHLAKLIFASFIEKYDADIALKIYVRIISSLDFQNLGYVDNYLEFDDGKYFVSHKTIESKLFANEDNFLIDILDTIFIPLNDYIEMKLIRIGFSPFLD